MAHVSLWKKEPQEAPLTEADPGIGERFVVRRPSPMARYRGRDGKFVKGHPGNRDIIDIREQHVWKLLDEEMTEEESRAIIRKAIEQAKGGDRYARDFLFDRRYGKPRQMTELPQSASPVMQLLMTWLGAAPASPELDGILDSEAIALDDEASSLELGEVVDAESGAEATALELSEVVEGEANG